MIIEQKIQFGLDFWLIYSQNKENELQIHSKSDKINLHSGAILHFLKLLQFTIQNHKSSNMNNLEINWCLGFIQITYFYKSIEVNNKYLSDLDLIITELMRSEQNAKKNN